MHIDHDMFADLATAVYAGDLETARCKLDLMRAIGGENTAHLLMRARRVSHPLPPMTPMAAAIPLPQPGASPREVFGASFTGPFA
ncbi:hypothetical protein GGR39_002380 [Novosphingobium fluoreni]|uniref:Uncharacterized protein n=1 Tax=Novosphingobium fluoreni TaxID=1391222 RepID=A0A7W6C4I5_9SPHN|nr:hypothetical protein [Novosphingobium fluoreni]MBB3940723.1 hypothetical protein [Novosphingobium fluoreni]